MRPADEPPVAIVGRHSPCPRLCSLRRVGATTPRTVMPAEESTTSIEAAPASEVAPEPPSESVPSFRSRHGSTVRRRARLR